MTRLFCIALIFLMTLSDLTAARRTIDDRLAEFGTAARARLGPDFAAAGVNYPPRQIVLIGLKEERLLELHAAGADGVFHFVRDYPVRAASGSSGPKLRRGDNQVPEGIYRVEALNPNSRFHLSLRLDYPNAFDRARAAEDVRPALGGAIMIHGEAASKGCLAMGNPAAEELFVLAADTGLPNIAVILAPRDLRRQSLGELSPLPGWTDDLYKRIREELAKYPKRQNRC
ncbi:MAG: L,D-transpeptidase family protein [Verrucomicrobiota bacterium]|nr:L,D-transpeptidase family protein [Verrucomicrobiota bacterium]